MSPEIIAAIAAVGGIAVWLSPNFKSSPKQPLSASSRAKWVADLLQLAEDATSAGAGQVASAARSLVEALIGAEPPSRKSKS